MSLDSIQSRIQSRWSDDPSIPNRKWVDATGPSPCTLMITGEAPGKDEVRQGICFVGKTGKELDNLILKFLRRYRESVYCTNMFKYQLNDKKQYSLIDWFEMSDYLEAEIEEVNPDVILALGSIAIQFFLGDLGKDVECLNGMPHEWRGRVVVPCYHPAASFHESFLLQWIIEAFENCKAVLDGVREIPPTPEPTIVIPMRDLPLRSPIAIDTETDIQTGRTLMITASTRDGESGYLFVDDDGSEAILERLGAYVAREGVVTLMHNALFDLPKLSQVGIVPSRWVCTMQKAFLLQTLPLGLKSLAYRLCRMKMRSYDDVVPDGQTVLDIPREMAIEYAGDDSCATLRVNRIMDMMAYPGMDTVAQRDYDIMPMVVSMMERGIGVDLEFFTNLEARTAVENHIRLQRIQEMVGIPDFNPASAKQLSQLLYTDLELGKGKKIKKTKWGGATDAKHLKKIEGEHEVIPLIQEWKTYDTLLDKYLSILPKLSAEDGRIHPDIMMSRVKHSGRFASKNPNLLAQPTRTREGREIRNGYVAADGYVICSNDFSGIEMRVAADESGDEEMIRVFRSGGDIHTNTAMRIFGISNPSDVDEMRHRYPAKRVGFGVLYGLTPPGLARELQAEVGPEWTEGRCEDLIDAWFDVHKGIKRYMNNVHAHARRYGWVEDRFGRRTFTPEVNSVYSQTRKEGLRKAGNMGIQSGAQGIMKEAMRKVWWDHTVQEYHQKGLLYFLVQIHDDLLVECHKSILWTVAPVIKHTMENAVKLCIPTPVDGKYGERWGSMEKLKLS